jgi:hypothetical protein
MAASLSLARAAGQTSPPQPRSTSNPVVDSASAAQTVALADIDRQGFDDGFLAQLGQVAITVTLQAGEQRVQDLQFTGGR